VGDMLRQTDVGHKYALEVARHDCDNGRGMTIERFAQLCVQGGILANVYTHVRPCTALPATADSRTHEYVKQRLAIDRTSATSCWPTGRGWQVARGRSVVVGRSLWRPRLP
jgi:hypothetical protein